MKNYLIVNIYPNYLIFKNKFQPYIRLYMLLNRDFNYCLFLFNSFLCDIKCKLKSQIREIY